MADETLSTPHSAPEIQASQLIEEGSGKKLLSSEDIGIGHATQVGKMRAPAKQEFYAHLFRTQLTEERDRLLREKERLEMECRHLRASDKELHALRSSLTRDRWEFAVAAIAMAIGGSLISSFPAGTPSGFAGIGPQALFGTGWALIILGAVWQVGKTAIITVHDALVPENSPSKKPYPTPTDLR